MERTLGGGHCRGMPAAVAVVMRMTGGVGAGCVRAGGRRRMVNDEDDLW